MTAGDWPDFSAEEPEFPFSIDRLRLRPGIPEAELIRRADDRDAAALYDLGLFAWNRAQPSVTEPWPNARVAAKACEWFGKAADEGLGAGAFAIGCIEMTVVGLKSVRDARMCFEEAARLGYAQGQEALRWVDEHYTVISTPVRK